MTSSNESFDASQYKVLCVDDEPNILSALRRMLTLEGFEVFTAEGGAQALELLAKQPIQVIISDMQMPEMNGAQLLEQVTQQWPQTMRLLLTGASDVSGAIDAINQGAIYRYIAKPWNDEELLSTIKSASHRLGAEFTAQHSPLHRSEVTLERVVTRQKEIGDRRGLGGAQGLATGHGFVHRQGGFNHLALAQLGRIIASKMLGEQALQFRQGGGNNLAIGATNPFVGRGEHQLQHRTVWIFVLATGVTHVCIDTEQIRATK